MASIVAPSKGREKNRSSFPVELIVSNLSLFMVKGAFFIVYAANVTQLIIAELKKAYITSRKPRPSKIARPKSKMKSPSLNISKYTFGLTSSKPRKRETKTALKREKGITAEIIFNGVESAGMWNIFVEITPEMKNSKAERKILVMRIICRVEITIVWSFDRSFLPL